MYIFMRDVYKNISKFRQMYATMCEIDFFEIQMKINGYCLIMNLLVSI
jgi:hypothetical protein